MLNRMLERGDWILGGLGLLSLAALIGFDPIKTAAATELLLSTVLVALLALAPIPFGSGKAIPAHAVTAAAALAWGPTTAAISLGIGMALGQAARAALEPSRVPTIRQGLTSWALEMGQHGTSLAIGIFSFLILGGILPLPAGFDWFSPPMIGLTVGFLAPFIALQTLKWTSLGSPPPNRTQRLAFGLIVGFLPLPYAALTAIVVQNLGPMTLLILGGGPAVLSPIIRGLMLAEHDLQRRISELSTLGEVSQAMRSSLNLDAILHTIYLQVAHLLNVHNFYVALHDPREGTLSYPLSIRSGQREHWPDREVSDRLTDRVILEGEPILIEENAPQALKEMGLPELTNAPEAWLGVPLQNPDRVIGCLAVFHLESGAKFDEKDQALLVTLAGQTSVAVENALLYQETRRRGQALASLSEITSQMSSSLDPGQTLTLVARSLTRVVGGDRAAIYLLSEDGTELTLAESSGLSDELRAHLNRLPLQDEPMTRAYRSRTALVREDLRLEDDLPAELGQAMGREGIVGSIDIPLVTPSGSIGMASVFFENPVQLEPEQLDLLEIFVAQSAIAVANARAHMATDQALKRQVEQLSRLEAIGRELVSTLNPDELFESILQRALKATDSHVGHLAVASEDDEGLRLVAHQGYPEESDLPIGGAHPPSALGLAGRAFHKQEMFNIGDVRREPGHVDWTNRRTLSLLAIPIRRWGRSIGVLTIESPEVDAFGPEPVRFVSQLTAYAAVAITNAGLYRQLEEHLREQSLLFQASAQIATSMEEDIIAMAVADSLSVALEASLVTVYRRNEDHQFEALATAHEGRVLRPRQPGSSDHREFLLASVKAGVPSNFEMDGRVSLTVPLQVGGEPIGLLEITRDEPQRYTEAEIRTAQTVGSQAAIALQNSQLFRQIRESHDRMMAVLNSSREGILMVDREGRVVLANQQLETLLGLSHSELHGSSLLDGPFELRQRLGFKEHEVREQFSGDPNPWHDLDDGKILHTEVPQERLLRRVLHPVQDAEGGRMGWLIVLHDVTEEREIEETREQLTQMIVHDLRSPLTTIRGSLHLLERSLAEESRSQVTSQAINVSHRSLNQLLGLVDSLLDLARLEGDPLQVERSEIEVDRLLEDLAEAFVPEANEEGIIVNVQLPDRLPVLRADEEKIRRVLHNLLDNALKFTPEGGRVDLRAKISDGNLRISISDTGPGIPEEMREKIFDRFAQVPGHAGRRRGTGLGLAFAKLAVEAHGGRIWVEESPHGGSNFCIVMPTTE